MKRIDLPLPGSADLESKKKAAVAFEAHFVKQLLSELRTSSGGLFGSSFAAGTFQELLETALSENIAESGGFHLAEVFQRELDPNEANLPRADGTKAHFTSVSSAFESYAVTSAFGPRIDPLTHREMKHQGVDLAMPEGTPVVATLPGRVVRAEEVEGYGRLVEIDHGRGVSTRYAHLSEIQVQKGASVALGAALGVSGASGRATGPHLHFEVRRNGEPIDPLRVIPGLKKRQ